jgi:aspartyl-tRNA(Asn)/glutamyl-tRNA(Gln) amidotransferase subunit A
MAELNGELVELSACQALRSFARRELSAVELVRACAEHLSSVEPDIKALLTLCIEEAEANAVRSDARWRAGTQGPLEGVPFGAKDVIATAGVRTTGGSIIYEDAVPQRNATVVELLKRSGAILFAKTQTFEFAFGDNSHYGPTRNPWDLSRTPGGSSSGSAAAVAAREVPVALGTDTGGSIRIPATFCGVVGLKPTYGRISRHGVMTASWTLDHVGPIARTVEDVALLMSVLAEYDPLDPTSADVPAQDYKSILDGNVAGLRIALPTNWFFDVCDPEMAEATHACADALASEGATIVEVEVPHAHLAGAIAYTIMFAEFASLHEGTLNRLSDYSEGMTQQLLVTSQFVSASDYIKALRSRHLLQRDFSEIFQKADALLTPGAVAAAPGADLAFEVGDQCFQWSEVVGHMTMVMNLCGVPAMAMPAGLSRHELPLGVQVASRPFDEVTCLKIGRAYQRVTDHHLKIPPFIKENARTCAAGTSPEGGEHETGQRGLTSGRVGHTAEVISSTRKEGD